MTPEELLKKIQNNLGLPAQDGDRPHFFLAQMGDQIFEIQCLEVDSGAWLDYEDELLCIEMGEKEDLLAVQLLDLDGTPGNAHPELN